MSDSPKYYRPYLDSLHSHCWDDRCAVYHVDSGDSHLLDKLDLTVLQQIGSQPVTSGDLVSKIKPLFEGDSYQYIEALLINFEKLGLVEVIDGKLSS